MSKATLNNLRILYCLDIIVELLFELRHTNCNYGKFLERIEEGINKVSYNFNSNLQMKFTLFFIYGWINYDVIYDKYTDF